MHCLNRPLLCAGSPFAGLKKPTKRFKIQPALAVVQSLAAAPLCACILVETCNPTYAAGSLAPRVGGCGGDERGGGGEREGALRVEEAIGRGGGDERMGNKCQETYKKPQETTKKPSPG